MKFEIIYASPNSESAGEADRAGLRPPHQDDADRLEGGDPQGRQEPGRGRRGEDHHDQQSHSEERGNEQRGSPFHNVEHDFRPKDLTDLNILNAESLQRLRDSAAWLPLAARESSRNLGPIFFDNHS